MEKAMIYLVEATTQFSDELEEFKQEIILYDADNEDQLQDVWD